MHPSCLTLLALSILDLSCQLWGIITFEWVISLCLDFQDNFISPTLIQAVFPIGDLFWVRENWHPKYEKNLFFQDKFYPLKSHAHYFTVLTYLSTSRAAKLSIFIHFMFTNLPWCSKSINSLIYVYTMQIPSCFLWVLDQLWLHFSILPPPKKISVLPHLIYNFHLEKFHQNLR